MKFFAISLALLSIFSSKCANICRGKPKQQYLQSGSLQLTNSINYKDSCFQLPIQFNLAKNATFKSMVAVSNMEGFGLFRNGVDFSLRSRKKNNSNTLSVYFYSADKNWRKITISYLFTVRDDIILGSFIADTFALCGCQSRGDKYILQQSIPYLNNINSSKITSLTYISGIRSTQNNPIIKLSQQKIDYRTGILSLKLQTDTPNIQNIQISYIIYKYQNFEMKVVYSSSVLQDGFNFAASRYYSKNKLQAEFLIILTDRYQCLGAGCINKCVAKRQCIGSNSLFNIDTCYICGKNEKAMSYGCQQICGPRTKSDGKGGCICANGYVAVGSFCMPQCPINQQYQYSNNNLIDMRCDCRNGYVRQQGTCRQCPINSKYINGKCVCNTSDYRWDDIKFCCNKVSQSPIIPPQPIIICPVRSQWNQNTLSCQCLYFEQHMINNKCDKCNTNQIWNGKECICKQGLNRVKGLCQLCDINSNFDGNTCVCNWGFFLNNDRCQKCHPTCGRCNGSGANKCIDCSDVYLNFKDGYCTKQNTPCFSRQYYENATCKDCSPYCTGCTSLNSCNSCIPGFQLSTTRVDNEAVSFCNQICGDGKRFQVQCDDGNKKDGDGCSSTCKVQNGYSCEGASTIRPSTCTKKSYPKTQITLTKTVNYFGKVLQGMRMNYLPPQLTANDCLQCDKILTVKIVSSPLVPSIRVSFLPTTQYQFYCQFDFNGIWAIPVFTISIQINQDYTKYFSSQDASQYQVKQIDPAILARVAEEDTLTLDQITTNNKIKEILSDQN